jgi:two-component system sensor kinase FixL
MNDPDWGSPSQRVRGQKVRDMTGSFEEISFRALFDAAADAMLMVNSAGLVVLSNTVAQLLLGYSRQELNGLSIEALIPEHYRGEHRRHQNNFLHEPIKRAMGSRRELYALSREGLELPVDISLNPIKAGDGKSFTLVTINSIAERKQMEQELRIAEERLRLAAEAAHFGTFDADLVTSKLYWSPELLAIVGLPPGAQPPALGEEFTYLHPDEIERVRALLRSAYGSEGNGEVNDEQRIVRPDGSVRWLLVKGKAQFAGAGETRRAVRATGIVLDITERKNMDSEILGRQKKMDELQKLQIASQTASAFAHELNQPLLAIASYSEAALLLLDAKIPDYIKIRKAVEASERQAHRAGQSIRDLLDFLSLNDFPTEAFDLNKEIHNILDSAKSEHELQFNTILHLEDRLPLIHANRIHVQKVLLNLLHNGIEVMQEVGVPLPSITVTVRTIKDESVAQVTIQDNGPGIKKEHFHRLFEPFFTTKAEGIGMGLAVSRSLIEANGGQLWVDPQEGPGATFHLTLPFAK